MSKDKLVLVMDIPHKYLRKLQKKLKTRDKARAFMEYYYIRCICREFWSSGYWTNSWEMSHLAGLKWIKEFDKVIYEYLKEKRYAKS